MSHQFDFSIFHCDEENDLECAIGIAERLENAGQNLKGFVEERDASPTRMILSTIEMAITESRYVIVVFSNTALDDSLLMHKLHMSIHNRLDNPALHSTIIPVYLPGLNVSKVPSYLNMINPIWFMDDNSFWNRMLRLFQ